ncbi:MAG: alpha/beta hydrolase [Solobacterium sp.]|nr:alpha/beta hydrolase [Solobacterium sp.]
MKNGEVRGPFGTMDYVSFGSGSRQLVILPGLSDGLATVKGKAMLLAPAWKPFFKDYTITMFSRRNDLPRGITIKEMAQDQADAMHILHLEHACVMGVSQGGMVAQLLAADHPECVDCLILVVTSPYCSEYIRANLEHWKTLTAENRHREFMIDTAEKTYSEAHLKTFRLMYPILGLLAKPKSYERLYANIDAIESFDARNDLSRITCPVLILGGKKDLTVSGEASQMIHEAIPASELYMYEEYGHGLYEEAKDFNARILEFLKTHG